MTTPMLPGVVRMQLVCNVGGHRRKGTKRNLSQNQHTMNLVAFNDACVYVCIYDAQRSSVAVH